MVLQLRVISCTNKSGPQKSWGRRRLTWTPSPAFPLAIVFRFG